MKCTGTYLPAETAGDNDKLVSDGTYLEVIEVLFAVFLQVEHDASAAAVDWLRVIFLDEVRVVLPRLPFVLIVIR